MPGAGCEVWANAMFRVTDGVKLRVLGYPAVPCIPPFTGTRKVFMVQQCACMRLNLCFSPLWFRD